MQPAERQRRGTITELEVKRHYLEHGFTVTGFNGYGIQPGTADPADPYTEEGIIDGTIQGVDCQVKTFNTATRNIAISQQLAQQYDKRTDQLMVITLVKNMPWVKDWQYLSQRRGRKRPGTARDNKPFYTFSIDLFRPCLQCAPFMPCKTCGKRTIMEYCSRNCRVVDC